MYPILNIGPLAIPVPEFILIFGFWVGSYSTVKMNIIKLPKPEILEKILWTSLIAGTIGARVSFIARNPTAFSGNILSIISLNPHLFDLSGGLIISFAAGIIISMQNNLPLRKTMDGLVPFLSIFTIAIHLSRFASGTGFGIEADLPWSVNLWGASRHPVQAYYLLGGILVLVFVRIYFPQIRYTQGLFFSWFLFLTSTYMLIFVRYQAPDILVLNDFRLNQILYWIVLLISMVIINHLTNSRQKQENDVIKE